MTYPDDVLKEAREIWAKQHHSLPSTIEKILAGELDDAPSFGTFCELILERNASRQERDALVGALKKLIDQVDLGFLVVDSQEASDVVSEGRAALKAAGGAE